MSFGPQHLVEDEKVLSIAIEHSEGDFPSLSIVIKNPRIGLLAPARKTWAWLSHDGGTPLFFGRLVGVPSSINQNAVTLEFIGAAGRLCGAEGGAWPQSLRSLPYYDPVFLTPEAQADPDTVLEARPELWHIDRTTLAVTTSHILVGEDGVEEFLENEVPYDSVAISIGQVPTRALTVTADVSWTQSAQGSIDVGIVLFRDLQRQVADRQLAKARRQHRGRLHRQRRIRDGQLQHRWHRRRELQHFVVERAAQAREWRHAVDEHQLDHCAAARAFNQDPADVGLKERRGRGERRQHVASRSALGGQRRPGCQLRSRA